MLSCLQLMPDKAAAFDPASKRKREQCLRLSPAPLQHWDNHNILDMLQQQLRAPTASWPLPGIQAMCRQAIVLPDAVQHLLHVLWNSVRQRQDICSCGCSRHDSYTRVNLWSTPSQTANHTQGQHPSVGVLVYLTIQPVLTPAQSPWPSMCEGRRQYHWHPDCTLLHSTPPNV